MDRSIVIALINAYRLIEYANIKGAYTMRGGDHYIQTTSVDKALCEALGLDYNTIKTEDLMIAMVNFENQEPDDDNNGPMLI